MNPEHLRNAGLIVTLGVVMAVIGLGLIWLPLALIAGGAVFVLLGVLLAQRGGPA